MHHGIQIKLGAPSGPWKSFCPAVEEVLTPICWELFDSQVNPINSLGRLQASDHIIPLLKFV